MEPEDRNTLSSPNSMCIGCTRSPFVRLPRLAVCSRWNFLQDMGGVHRIGLSGHYFIYLYLRCKVYSCLFNQIICNHILTEEKQNHHFPPQLVTSLFSVTTLHTTSLVLLSYSTASISHPIPLSAANCLFCLNLSVCNPSYLLPTVSWMYIDSLNLRRTVLNCQQLTPEITFSVVPTMFSYVGTHQTVDSVPANMATITQPLSKLLKKHE